GAPLAPLGPGHDVVGGPVRGRRPLPLLHLPARPRLAGRRARRTAEGAHARAPGHFAHARRLRQVGSDVRRTLHSLAFVEGWAHYGEEVCVEEGFRADDPRFAAGVALEALPRGTRLATSLRPHAFSSAPPPRSEAARATFDPTYGRYTWGKLEIQRLRGRARAAWGAGFSLQRFHDTLLSLGSPPLGLLPAVLDPRR